MHITDVIYSDLNIKQIESLPITQPHRSVDITVTDADKEGESAVHIELNTPTIKIITSTEFRLCQNLYRPSQHYLGHRLGIPGRHRIAE